MKKVTILVYFLMLVSIIQLVYAQTSLSEINGNNSLKDSKSIPSGGYILVCSSNPASVLSFDPVSGDLIDENFIPADGNLIFPFEILYFPPNNSLLVCDMDGFIKEFDEDGIYLGIFAPLDGTTLTSPRGIELHPISQNILITSSDGRIVEYDESGFFIQDFIAAGISPLLDPRDIKNRPVQNDFLVSCGVTDAILQYDINGSYIGEIITGGTILYPQQISISTSTDNILVSNSMTPSGLNEFSSNGTYIGFYDILSGLKGNIELPDGNFLVSRNNGIYEIDQFNTLIDTIYSGVNARYISFVNPAAQITFIVDMHEETISPFGVHIAASFQDPPFEPGDTEMINTGGTIYEYTLSVNPGEYIEYTYINGILWGDEEIVPPECSMGGLRYLTVPDTDTILPVVCFGSCDTCVPEYISLDLKVFLEGPFNGTDMNTDLNELGYLPLSQPYDSVYSYQYDPFGGTPPGWVYNGSESVDSIPNENIVDWVLVELRDATHDTSAQNAPALDRQAAFLLKDGSIVGLDGSSILKFLDITIQDSLFVGIWHRNHIATLSINPLIESSGVYQYDFSLSANTSICDHDAGIQWQINPGIWGMIAYDGNSDGWFDGWDHIIGDNNWGLSGYLPPDYNMDGCVLNRDLIELALKILGAPPGVITQDQLTFRIANFQILSGTPEKVKFDIEIKADTINTFPEMLQVLINYDTLGFNSDIVSNSHIFLTPLEFIKDEFGSLLFDFRIVDSRPNRFAILIGKNHINTPSIPTSFVGLLQVQMDISDPDYISEIEFIQKYMNKGQWQILDAPAKYYYTPNLYEGEIFYLDTKVFLEGPFNGMDMNTDLNSNGEIPMINPYGTSPWYYQGYDSVLSIPNPEIIDWLLLELRNADSAAVATPETSVGKKAVFLMEDGSIMGITGHIKPMFSCEFTKQPFAVIKHRNHLGAISASPLIKTGDEYSYDFSTGANHVFGSTSGHKEIGSGIWGLISGDANSDGIITHHDKNNIWNNQTGKKGYLAADYNLNVDADNIDKNDYWWFNMEYKTQVPGENSPPHEPFNPIPHHGAINIEIDTTLAWQCTDPDEQDIFFVLFFGTDAIPPLVQPNYTNMNYDPVMLDYNTDYYWKIIAVDTHGDSTSGPIWQFTTKNQPPDKPFDPSPENLATGISIDTIISWSCSDPDNDPLTYNIYFGTEADPPLIQSSYPDTAYTPGTLELDTTYFWKIVSYDSHGDSAIGDVWSFTTLANMAPNIPSNPSPAHETTNISIDTTLSWYCSDPNGDNLTYNIYFGAETDPMIIALNHPDTFYSPGIMIFDTSYYWKIVAYDSHGDSAVGNVWTFSTQEPGPFECGNLLYDDRDGQTYNTVLIGTQCWMAENLNVGTMLDINLDFAQDNQILEKFCYDNDSINCENYGAFYQWGEMLQYDYTTPGTQGICPEGWHIPTDSEWKILEGTVDSHYNVGHLEWDYWWSLGDPYLWRGHNAGYALKSISGWDNNGNGADLVGFNALPSGYRWCYELGIPLSFDLGVKTYFWLNNDFNLFDFEWLKRSLLADSSNIMSHPTGFAGGPCQSFSASVRCLKDPYNQPPSEPEYLGPVGDQVAIDTALSWTCIDPEGDSLAYDVYFGSDLEEPFFSLPPFGWPPLVASSITDTIFDPGILEPGITYYYLIRAFDDQLNYSFLHYGQIGQFTTLANLAPDTPSNPSPADGAINITIDTVISWTCVDPESDPLHYSIYFGIEPDPPLVQINHADTFYNPGTLQINTEYYWKIVAYDPFNDSVPGDIWSFITIFETGQPCPGTPTVTDIDGNTYNTVQIGTQCWMAENLNVGRMIIGINNQANNDTIEKYCYDNNTSYCDTLGGLYQWNEMMQYSTSEGSQGICPDEWHIPTENEWETLETYIDPSSSGLWCQWNGTDGGTNLKQGGSTGFNALMTGLRSIEGLFGSLETRTYFSTSTEDDETHGTAWHLDISDSRIYQCAFVKEKGFSVRCLKD